MTSYGDEAGHENTAQHIQTSPEHTAKQKKLAKSFLDKMSGSVAEAVSPRLKLADALRKEGEKRKASEERARLMMQQGREKQALADQHKKEKENLTKEEVDEPTGELKDACWKGYTAVGMKMKNGKKVPNCVPIKEEEEKEDDDLPEMSDDEIEAYANDLSDDDYLETYDDDELGIVDSETGEELEADEEEENKLKESVIMEVLSRAERMKAVSRIRRTKAKRERAAQIAIKRYSDTKTINKRSRRLAVKLMKKRLLRGRDPSKLSVGEKERIERMIETRKAAIGRIAMRPRVRKMEKARLSHSKYTQGSQNVAF